MTVLKKGSYFGEIGLLRTCRRTASIRAISETVDLFVLSKVCLSSWGHHGIGDLLECFLHVPDWFCRRTSLQCGLCYCLPPSCLCPFILQSLKAFI